MPNTLVHFAVQGITARAITNGANIKWVFLGCVIPDVPWIFQRIVRFIAPHIDVYALKMYVAVQASLLFGLLLSISIAAITRRPKIVFTILGVNVFVHLLLDACEIKPGSGVHFYAPFSWELTNFGLVWPENIVVTMLTVIGLVYIVYRMTKNTENYIVLDFKSRKSTGTFFLGIVGYFLLPLVLMGNVAENDNYSLKTLQAVDNRIGRKIELDREEYVPDGQNGTVKTFSGERLYLVAENLPAAPAVVSLRGTFINNDTIRVDDLHINQSRFRDGASIVGLSMLMLMWLSALIKGRKAIPRNIR